MMDFPFMYLSGASQLSYVSPATSWESATAENLLSSWQEMFMVDDDDDVFLSKSECERKNHFWQREKTNL